MLSLALQVMPALLGVGVVPLAWYTSVGEVPLPSRFDSVAIFLPTFEARLSTGAHTHCLSNLISERTRL